MKVPAPHAIRPPRGKVHVAVPARGRGWRTICGHPIASPNLEVFLGPKKSALAWEFEECCLDCEAIVDLGDAAVIAALLRAAS